MQSIEESCVSYPIFHVRDQNNFLINLHHILLQRLSFVLLDFGKTNASSFLPLAHNEGDDKLLGQLEECSDAFIGKTIKSLLGSPVQCNGIVIIASSIINVLNIIYLL